MGTNSTTKLKVGSGGELVLENQVEGFGFSFLYDFLGYNPDYTTSGKELFFGDNGITHLHTGNKYYYRIGSRIDGLEIGGNPPTGISNAIKINNEEVIGESYGTKEKYSVIKQLAPPVAFSKGFYGITLANCVGYAHGRVREIWGAAKDSGYIHKDPSTNKYITINSNQIYGDLDDGSLIPNTDAYTFYDRWPSREGFTKTFPKSSDNLRPLPGDIICYSNGNAAGHVAVVEAVFNRGKPDEYIIISHSKYKQPDNENIICTKQLKRNYKLKGAPYGFGGNYKFLGFLRSPVSQLSSMGSGCYYSESEEQESKLEIPIGITVEAPKQTWVEKLKEANKKALGLWNSSPELKTGDEVQVTWLGNTKSNGAGKNKNLLGSTVKVKTINLTEKYPYGVTLDGSKVIGYFTRDGLVKTDR